MFSASRACAALAAAALSMAPASADVIGTLYNTGLDDNRAILAAGAVDPHYELVGAMAQAYGSPVIKSGPERPGSWTAETGGAGWINPCVAPGTDLAPGPYHYRTTFDLTCFDKKSAEIRLRFSADNHLCDVLLNGVQLGLGWTSYEQWSPTGVIRNTEVVRMDGSVAQFDSLFVEGLNTLEFVVENWGDPSFYSPSGLMVDMQGAATKVCGVPEPGSVALMGLAAAAGWWFRRRRQPAA